MIGLKSSQIKRGRSIFITEIKKKTIIWNIDGKANVGIYTI